MWQTSSQLNLPLVCGTRRKWRKMRRAERDRLGKRPSWDSCRESAGDRGTERMGDWRDKGDWGNHWGTAGD